MTVFEITKAAGFDAAHYIEDGPADHRYRRLHGHSFRVEVSLRGGMKAGHGWVEDLGEVDSALSEAAKTLDHGLLNELPGLETPTLENLCLWFAGQLKPRFPGLSKVAVSRPTIGERCELRLD